MISDEEIEKIEKRLKEFPFKDWDSSTVEELLQAYKQQKANIAQKDEVIGRLKERLSWYEGCGESGYSNDDGEYARELLKELGE